MENNNVNLTLGETLAQRRSVLALSISEVSKVIGIRPTVLFALEEDRLNDIGAPVYIKSYILRYAEFLKIDKATVLKKLQSSLKHQKVIKITPIEEQYFQYKRRGFLWLYSILLVFVLSNLGVYFWPQAPEVLPDSNYIATTRTEISQAVDKEMKRESDDASYFSQAITNIDNVSDLSNLTNSSDQSEEIEKALSKSELTLSLASNHSVQNEAESELKITVQDSCWAEIRDADRKKILYSTLQANEVYTVKGKPPFNIKFGNVQSILSFELNGQTVDTELYRPNLKMTVSRFRLGEVANTDRL